MTNTETKTPAKTVNVAVGVIIKVEPSTQQTMYFVCRREAHQHQGNKWEFPGGKIEADETIAHALKRELAEEIGIKVITSTPLTLIEFSYPDKRVKLHVHMVTQFDGQAHGAEGQVSQWVDFSTLSMLDFPEANQSIIQDLKQQVML